MRICLYTETALPKMGGQEVVVDTLAREFQALGHAVTVLAPHPRLPLRARDEDLPYRVVRHPRFYSTRYFVKWYRWWLVRLYRKFPFDIVHCHGIYPTGFLAARLRQHPPYPPLAKGGIGGVPVVITSHGGDVNPDSRRVQRLQKSYQEAVQKADALIAISRFTEQGLVRLGADSSSIRPIPNGVHVDLLAAPAARPVRLDPAIQPGQYVLFLGRLVKRKGVDLLLRALRLIPDSGGVQLVIAGDGEERPNLESLVSRLRLGNRVRFVGATLGPEKTYLLQNARCLAALSRGWEAFGLVVLESFAAGTPVLASKLPGLGDLIEPERTGWLVPPESIEVPAQILKQIFSGGVDLPRLSQQAKQAAQAYRWSKIAEHHVQLYTELLQRRHKQAG